MGKLHIHESPRRDCERPGKARQAYLGQNATHSPLLGLLGAIRIPYPKGLNC